MAEDLHGLNSNFDQLLGSEIVSLDPDAAACRVELRDELRQPYGILHGGVVSSLVEGLCSYATAVAVYEQGKLAMGQTIDVSFLRPISTGPVEVKAVALHRGSTTWVWNAEVRDGDGKLGAIAKMTMAVRPAPAGTPGFPESA